MVWKCSLAGLALALGAGSIQADQVLASFGDWQVARGRNVPIAGYTRNGDGALLMFACGEQGACHWYVGLRSRCVAGQGFALLINADTAALSVDATCTGASTGADAVWLLRLPPDRLSDLSRLMLKGEQIGFAIPLEGGRFSVTRFSLDGAGSTLRQVAQLLREGLSEPTAPAVSEDRGRSSEVL